MSGKVKNNISCSYIDYGIALHLTTFFGHVSVFCKKVFFAKWYFNPISEQTNEQQEAMFKHYGLESFIVYDYGFYLRFGIEECVSIDKGIKFVKSLESFQDGEPNSLQVAFFRSLDQTFLYQRL